MKRKLAIVLGVVAFSLISLTACSTSSNQEKEMGEKGDTIVFTDSVDRKVELPSDITKVITTGPLGQIILFALAPDDLVGISDPWSEASKQYIDPVYYDLPVLGSLFGSKDINIEQLVAASPQVIIDIGEVKDSIKKDMDDLQVQTGIPVVHIDASMATMGETYRTLGKMLNCQAQGEALATYCEETYANIGTVMENVGTDNKSSVAYCLGADGLNVMAENSYHAEILNLIADNVAKVDNPASKGTGTAINMEQLMVWDPDIILFDQDSIYDTVSTNPDWQNLKAIKNDNYYKVPSAPYNWMGFPPSVQRYLGMLWMTDLLYPNKANFDLYESVSKFYNLFYHYDLSKDQFTKLTANSLTANPNK